MPLLQERTDQPPPSDATLAAFVRSGNADALAALYERHAKTLLAISYRLLQSVEDAEDTVHDVFVGLPEALKRYDERGTLVAWLRTITARVALAKIRHANVRDNADSGVAEPVAPSPDVLDAISIEDAMKSLPASLRAVIVLKEVEGFSHAEIARMLGISVGASEVRLHRAVKALRTMLTKGD